MAWPAAHEALSASVVIIRGSRRTRLLTSVLRTVARVPVAWRVGIGVSVNVIVAAVFLADLPARLTDTRLTTIVGLVVLAGTALLATVVWQQALELAAARRRLAERTSRETAAYRLNALIEQGSRMLAALRQQSGQGLHPLFGPKWQDDVDAWVRDAQLVVDSHFLDRRSLLMSDAGLPPAPPGPDRVGAGWRDPLAAYLDRRLTRLQQYLETVVDEPPTTPQSAGRQG